MRRREPLRSGVWPALAALLMFAGCAGSSGPPPITIGTPCFACGMEVRDLRFACGRRAGDDWRVYDAIECLMRDASPAPGTADTWLADYDTRALYAADSVWVVRGAFASPMGGGLAAFRGRAAADSIAAMTSGRVDRLAAFMAEPPGDAR
jgi:hypothetical protein